MQMSGKNNFRGRLFHLGVEGGVSRGEEQLSESCMEANEIRAKTQRVP